MPLHDYFLSRWLLKRVHAYAPYFLHIITGAACYSILPSRKSSINNVIEHWHTKKDEKIPYNENMYWFSFLTKKKNNNKLSYRRNDKAEFCVIF